MSESTARLITVINRLKALKCDPIEDKAGALGLSSCAKNSKQATVFPIWCRAHLQLKH
jgi:hypothetical protein